MRILALLLAAVLLAFVTTFVFLDGPTEKKDDSKIGKLVRDLGSDDFEEREEATKALEKLGAKAISPLVQAMAKTKDPEVRRRAWDLVLKIMPAQQKSKSTGMKLVRVNAGEFGMGSPRTEPGRGSDEAAHFVRITVPIYMGAYEVTQEEYQKVMGTNPSWFQKKGKGKDKVGALDTGRFPVEQVTWFDAVEFCNRLSKLDGYTPYYELSDITKKGESIVGAKVKVLGGNGYRLPSEAEWENACRANTTTAFHYGANTTKGQANMQARVVSGGYGGSYALWPTLNRTEKVGTHPPNTWGLYDMHGNVAEWCEDWYGRNYYAVSPRDDPKGPATGAHRVLRGGHWQIKEEGCRSAARLSALPNDSQYYNGFRVARYP